MRIKLCLVIVINLFAAKEAFTSSAADLPKFEGKWKYHSFRPEPIAINTERENKTFEPWSPPPAAGDVVIDQGGTKGKLSLADGKINLDLSCTIIVSEGKPVQLSVTAIGKLGSTPLTNELHGYFVPKTPGKPVDDTNPLVVRGCIVQTSDAGVPANTVGYFVLEPAK